MNYPTDFGYKPCDTLDPRSPYYKGEQSEDHNPREPAPYPLEREEPTYETSADRENTQG